MVLDFGFGIRVSNFGFRLSCFWFRVSDFGLRVSADPEALDEGKIEGDREALREAPTPYTLHPDPTPYTLHLAT